MLTGATTDALAETAQMLVTEACGLLIEAGRPVPVLISANIPGGDENNDRLRAAYADRIKQGGP